MAMNAPVASTVPDAHGHFGPYGGRYVPETLMYPLQQLEEEYFRAQHDPEFQRELDYYLRQFCGRPSPLYFAERLTRELGGAKIYLKREDLLHTGAHKINNAMGQILVARRMGKTRIIAETGAGQHGVATATVAAMFGLKCVIYMGEVDCERQALNVYRMKMLGAEVVPVCCRATNAQGSRQRSDARLGDQCDGHPLHFGHGLRRASVSGDGAEFSARHRRRGAASNIGTGKAPARFADRVRRRRLERHRPFLSVFGRCFREDARRRGGRRRNLPGEHAARFQGGSLGVLQGTRSYILQDENGQIQLTHSVSAGLDYAAVGPEHAWLRDRKRVEYGYATDAQALDAFIKLARLEGIIPALESSHAIAAVIERAPKMSKDQLVIVNLSGRGDKDVAQAAAKIKL